MLIVKERNYSFIHNLHIYINVEHNALGYFFFLCFATNFSMNNILGDLISTKSLHSTDPIDRYIFDHSLRYTPEQLELLEDIKNLPGMRLTIL